MNSIDNIIIEAQNQSEQEKERCKRLVDHITDPKFINDVSSKELRSVNIFDYIVNLKNE